VALVTLIQNDLMTGANTATDVHGSPKVNHSN